MKIRVLVVDDNPADRALVNRLMRSSDLDADIVEIERASEFLDIPLENFDCILLDNRLPDRDGIDALIEASGESMSLPCPVVILSGQGDEHVAARAIKAGASDYLVKDSVTPNGLARAISNAMEKWQREERVRADWEQQRQALILAEQANWAKTQFLSNMSHELRTPLTAILGFSQLVNTQALGSDPDAWAKYVDYAGDINNSAQRLLDMISDVLDVARLEGGAQQLLLTEFSADECLDEALDMLDTLAKRKNLGVVADRPETPVRMTSDRRAVSVIMTNLLSNAVKHTPPDGHVRVNLRAHDGGKCVFSVADTGIGMNPEDLPRLLRPFERYDTAFATQAGGLGLGLSQVNSLVQSLQGALTFDTALGCGTTATVVMPTIAKITETAARQRS